MSMSVIVHRAVARRRGEVTTLTIYSGWKSAVDELVRSGRHVVVVGDFNVAHKDVDVHSRWKIEDCYSLGV